MKPLGPQASRLHLWLVSAALLPVLIYSAFAQNPSTARRIRYGTPPATCNPATGDVYIDTTVTPPDFVRCLATNKWVRESSGKVNAQTGTSYTFVKADRNKLVTFSNGSAIAVTLPQATASGDFLSGWNVAVYNLGAGTATITPTTSTINGGANITIATGEGAHIFSDGTNYSAVKTISTSSGGTVTPSSTDTFTNKTYDVEATGNTFTTYFFIEFTAAGTNAGTAAPFLNIPSSNGPAAGSIEGTNVINATLDFDASTDESVQGAFWLPSDWTGAIDFDVEGFANESGTNVARLGLQTICVGAGETYDPSWNTAQTFNWTNTGTNQRVTASQTPVTTTGCAAGERFFFKFYRDADGTSGTDSLGVDLRVVALRFKVRGTK